jgi:hypothetical protein
MNPFKKLIHWWKTGDWVDSADQPTPETTETYGHGDFYYEMTKIPVPTKQREPNTMLTVKEYIEKYGLPNHGDRIRVSDSIHASQERVWTFRAFLDSSVVLAIDPEDPSNMREWQYMEKPSPETVTVRVHHSQDVEIPKDEWDACEDEDEQHELVTELAHACPPVDDFEVLEDDCPSPSCCHC